MRLSLREPLMLYRTGIVLSLLTGTLAALATPKPQYPAYPSETPAEFKPVTSSFDYDRREVMVAMRDGVHLHTVILVPKGATHAPILLTRTPYDANGMTTHGPSAHLGPNLVGYDNALYTILEGGYIRVIQDIRGKYGSEGDYVMNRPVSGPLNPTPVDDATDTYDTIEWLVHHLPESNGRVGTLGISYDGFEPLMAAYHPHPALKVTVPMHPMVDGWMGDDWFHHGAFRQINLPYIHDQAGSRDNSIHWWNAEADDYAQYLKGGSAGDLARAHGLEQIGFWRKLIAHPDYDAFWQEQAVDRLLAREPLTVPMLLVHGLWDQEDIYGALAVYRALKPRDVTNDKVFLAIGPWYHGQEISDGSRLGHLRFPSDTALDFQRDVLLPFLDHYLKDEAPPLTVAPVTAYETGTNTWRHLNEWPSASGSRKPVATPMYLGANGQLTFEAPAATGGADSYVSDPKKPVPYRIRPINPVDPAEGLSVGAPWHEWLTEDQRNVTTRTDVLSYMTEPLSQPVQLAGTPMAHLVATTTGTDADWVVKLIDVYPDEVAGDPFMGGYELMVAADILRGRYREGFAAAKPITPGVPLEYGFDLPNVNHVFRKGHRIMVQIQSSWFPVYDRNPQTFVPNVLLARPEDYKAQTMQVLHDAAHASRIDLPLIPVAR
jgi:putative CocE/NonD family hydrolase